MANDKRFVVKNGLQTQNIEFVSADKKINKIFTSQGVISYEGSNGAISTLDSLGNTSFTGSVYGKAFYAGSWGQVIDEEGNWTGNSVRKGLRWTKISENYTASHGDALIADNSLSSFTITLLPGPVLGDTIVITDGGNFAINNVTVSPNGFTIENSESDLLINVRDVTVQLVFDGSTWQVSANIGPIGFTGSAGFQGSIGFTGSRGFTGSQGETGFTGSRGFTGSQGPIGFAGSQGWTGSQGIQGWTGSQGFTGSKGDIGFTGSQGIQGFTGSQGVIGFTGSTGFVGSQGFTGSMGPVAGTDGQVVYNNGGISGGANTWFDDTNQRLGILTSTPSATLDVVGDIEVNSNVRLNSEATTLTTTTKTQIASFPVASFRSGKLIVQAYDSVTGEVHISELLVAHNGTIASSTEYGVVYTGANPLTVYDVDISAGNARLMATRTTANSTQYKVSETLMVA